LLYRFKSLFLSRYFLRKIGKYRDPNFMEKIIIYKPIFRKKNREISRSIFYEKKFFVLIFFGIYHLENREISAIFFHADLRSLNWRFFFLGWVNSIWLSRRSHKNANFWENLTHSYMPFKFRNFLTIDFIDLIWKTRTNFLNLQFEC